MNCLNESKNDFSGNFRRGPPKRAKRAEGSKLPAPTPINFREAEIETIPATLPEKKIKVGIVPIPINFNEVEIGAIPDYRS